MTKRDYDKASRILKKIEDLRCIKNSVSPKLDYVPRIVCDQCDAVIPYSIKSVIYSEILKEISKLEKQFEEL